MLTGLIVLRCRLIMCWGQVVTTKIKNNLRVWRTCRNMRRSDTIKLEMCRVRYLCRVRMTWPCLCGNPKNQTNLSWDSQATELWLFKWRSVLMATTLYQRLSISQSNSGKPNQVNSSTHLEVTSNQSTKCAGPLTLACWWVGRKIQLWRCGMFKSANWCLICLDMLMRCMRLIGVQMVNVSPRAVKTVDSGFGATEI